MASQLGKSRPVEYVDANGVPQHAPLSPLLSNIPLLHDFLQGIVRDWRQAWAPFAVTASAELGNKVLSVETLRSVEVLRTLFLRSILSYACFFVSAVNAYQQVFDDLHPANRARAVRCRPPKTPRESDYIRKVRVIRNMSITHMGSRRRGTSFWNAWAAINWYPIGMPIPDDPDDIGEIEFAPGPFAFTRPDGTQFTTPDLKIGGMSELHGHCMPYLEEYDRACVEYMRRLRIPLASS